MTSLPTQLLLATTLRSIGDAVVTCDPASRIVMMNPVAEQLTGWSEVEALGHPLAEIFVIRNETSREPVEDPVAKVLRLGTVVGLANHTLLLRRDGTEIAIDDSAAPVHDETGALSAIVLVFRDVSRQRRAEWKLDLLAKSGHVLLEHTETTRIIRGIAEITVQHFADFCVFDLLTPATPVSDSRLSRIIGLHKNPALQPLLNQLVDFAPLPSSSEHPVAQVVATREHVLLTSLTPAYIDSFVRSEIQAACYRELRPHSCLWVPIVAGEDLLGVITFSRSLSPEPFHEDDVQTALDLGHRIGISLRNLRLLEELNHEKARLQAVLNSVPVGILVAEAPSGRIIQSNDAVERILRHPAIPTEDVASHGAWVAFHSDGRRVKGEEYPLPRAIASGRALPPEEYLYQRGDGTRAWVSLAAAPIFDEGKVTGGVVVVADIDHERAARESLRLSEERNRQILASTRDAILVLDLEGCVLSMNLEAQLRLGIDDFSQLQHTQWVEFWSPDHRAEAGRALTRAQIGEPGAFEASLVTTRGELTWWDTNLTPMFNADGDLYRLLVISREVTSRKQAELALRHSESRFRRLIENATIGILIGDVNGGLSYLNPSLLNTLGYTQHEVLSGLVRWDELTPSEYRPLDLIALEQLKDNGTCAPYEKPFRAKDGTLVPFLLGAMVIPATFAQLQEVAVFLTDLRPQKQAEAALVQSEKLAAVGKLASSISHEINNPLEAVTNLLYIVKADPGMSHETRDYLQMAEKELGRVSQVAAQTLRFHRQSTRPQLVPPHLLTDEVLALYAGRISNFHIKIRRQYADGVELTCYEGDIRQVLNNLIGNAIDAMRKGGTLTVRTRLATHWPTLTSGVRITVADNGPGMSAMVAARIFEAFFTTKGDNGTGLGLWISDRIVQKHHGRLRTRSRTVTPTGTVFTLWLPRGLAVTAHEPWHTETSPATAG